MFKFSASVNVKSDNTSALAKSVKTLGNADVYVGIPEGDQGDHPEITNAQLLYALTHGVRDADMRDEMQPTLDAGTPYSKAFQMFIHEHGSPLWRIPPRPVLEPAIENSKTIIAKQLKAAARATLDGADPTAELQKAGMLGMNAAKDWFTNPNNHWPANAPSTVNQKGSSVPNIDTGELRKSITYVVNTNA